MGEQLSKQNIDDLRNIFDFERTMQIMGFKESFVYVFAFSWSWKFLALLSCFSKDLNLSFVVQNLQWKTSRIRVILSPLVDAIRDYQINDVNNNYKKEGFSIICPVEMYFTLIRKQ